MPEGFSSVGGANRGAQTTTGPGTSPGGWRERAPAGIMRGFGGSSTPSRAAVAPNESMPDSSAPSGNARTYLAFGACTAIWGSTFLVISIGNDTVPPMWAAALRLVVAAIVMLGLTAVTGRRLPTGPALGAAAAYGALQFGINFPLLYWGETVVPSGLAAVVFATIPITSAVIARAFGIERLDPLKMGAAVVALGGVVVMFARELSSSVTALPLLAIYLATVSAAVGSVMLKRGPRQDPIGANAIAASVGAPFCLMASWLLHERRQLPTHWVEIYPVLYLALAGSVGAFVIYSWLVQRWQVSTVAFIGVVVPLIAVTLGVLVRHERLMRQHVLGSVLVLAGVSLAIASDRRRMRQAAAAAR
jgi:drug/metabolite transporter (DMT)-like permease